MGSLLRICALSRPKGGLSSLALPSASCLRVRRKCGHTVNNKGRDDDRRVPGPTAHQALC